MDKIIKGMLKRLNLSEDDYDISVDNKISGINDDYFTLEYRDGRVVIKGNCIISACNGLYYYLKKYQNVNLSWAGNRALITENLHRLKMRKLLQYPKNTVFILTTALFHIQCAGGIGSVGKKNLILWH